MNNKEILLKFAEFWNEVIGPDDPHYCIDERCIDTFLSELANKQINNKIREFHADLIITDMIIPNTPPTKWKMFLSKIGCYKNNKEKKRVYKWFDIMKVNHFTSNDTDTSSMFNSH